MCITKLSPKSVINFLLMLAIVITLIGFWVDIKNTIHYGGIDLRNRVVGARLLTREIDPYYFNWSNDHDEMLLDPNDEPGSTVSRVTVPPTVLLMHTPFANLSYFQQRLGWLIAQWVALLGSLIILVRSEASSSRRRLMMIAGLLLVSGSLFWRLHVERGQIYIFYVFLISLSYWVLQTRSRKNATSTKPILSRDVLGGCLIGLAASFRFPVIIMVLPMLAFKEFKLFMATLISFFIFLWVSIQLTGWQIWESYFSAIGVFTKVNLDSPQSSQSSLTVTLPKTIEGMTNLTARSPLLDSPNSSVQGKLHTAFNISLQSNTLLISLCAALLIYFLIIYLFCRTNHQLLTPIVPSLDLIFLIGTLMILICDLFLPAPRYPYNDVQFLIPLLLIVKHIDFSNQKAIYAIAILITGLCLTNGMFQWLSSSIVIGEFLTISCMIAMSLMITKGAFAREAVQSKS